MTHTHPATVVLTAQGRPNKRVLSKAATRQRVLNAATALFEAGPYAAATIRDIAKGAGMSTGAVFANFKNKAEIWTAVYGGPAPALLIADEIARTLGQLPDWTCSISHAGGRFTVALFTPDWTPEDRTAHEIVTQGDSGADALRDARLAAVAHLASHAVRSQQDRAA